MDLMARIVNGTMMGFKFTTENNIQSHTHVWLYCLYIFRPLAIILIFVVQKAIDKRSLFKNAQFYNCFFPC